MRTTTDGLGTDSFETAFMREFTAQPDDIDILGHVNNTVYVRWAEAISVLHWQTMASPALQEKYLFVMLRHEIDYREQVLAGETVEVRTWLGRARGPRFERFVDIRKPGAKRFSSFSRTDWCQLDAATRKPVRITEEILDTFQVTGKGAR